MASNIWTVLIYLIIYGIVASAVMTAYFMYARRFRIADAFNLKILSDSFGDVFAGLIFFVLKKLLLDIAVIGTVTYLFWIFADLTHVLYIYFLCMYSVFSTAVTGDYYAQMSYEAIEVRENDQ